MVRDTLITTIFETKSKVTYSGAMFLGAIVLMFAAEVIAKGKERCYEQLYGLVTQNCSCYSVLRPPVFFKFATVRHM